jgi:transcriptional regulator with XRE-family HTH domain
MPTLGQELKRLRENRGISLHQISDATHIGVRFLQAIESDTYDILPGGIFNRAFVRKFAAKVGMDEEEALSLYEKQIVESGGEEGPRNNYLRAEEFEEKKASFNWLGTAILLALLGAGLYAATTFFKNRSTPPDQSNLVSPTIAPTATATPDATASPVSSPSPGASPEASPAASPDASPAMTPPPGGMLVQLEALSGECWVSVKPDGLGTRQQLIKAGEPFEFTANEKMYFFSMGNYPALNIKINGRTINPDKLAPERKGVVVKNVLITKDNYQTLLN